MARRIWALVRALVAPASPPDSRWVWADFNGDPEPGLASLYLMHHDACKVEFNAPDFDREDDRDIAGIGVFKALTKRL
jgi:hypothetical protein